MDKLGFVFTNFNNSEYSLNLVRSLAALPSKDSFVCVIVDNASDPADKENLARVNEYADFVTVIYNSDNIGYFAGLNTGIRYLRNLDSPVEYIVVGNNDLLFSSDIVAQISVKKSLFSHYPVVSPDIVTLDGVHQNPHVISSISVVREYIWDLYYSNYLLARMILLVARVLGPLAKRKDEKQYRIPQEIHQGYGACYILGPLFFRLFDELWAPTFLMGEEFFLAKQLEGEGYSVYYEPTITVEHHDHATVGKLPGRKMWEIAKSAHKVYRELVPMNFAFGSKK